MGYDSFDAIKEEPLVARTSASSATPFHLALSQSLETYFSNMSPNISEPLNILVFGPTGAGKSTIINLLTNNAYKLPVGENLESCTKEIKCASIKQNGRLINLYDTPGFDDSEIQPAEHLQIVAVQLAAMYKEVRKPHIHGVIYLHRIIDNRMAGSGLTNLNIFESLIGDHVFKNLVFVTNLWTDPPKQKHINCEAQLIATEKYFGGAIAKGARAGAAFRVREDSSEAEVQKTLLDVFVDLEPKVTQIQTEVVDQRKPAIETTAGQAVHRKLEAIKKELIKWKTEHGIHRTRTEREQNEAKSAKVEKQMGVLKETNVELMDRLGQKGLARWMDMLIRPLMGLICCASAIASLC